MVKGLDLSEMTVEQKIGQLIVVRDLLTEEDEKFILEMIEKKSVGGIQIRFNDKYKDFMKKVHEKADYPILVCADMETGYPEGEGRYPCAMGIAACGNPDIAYELGRITAIEAKNAGANVIWGPVVDSAVEHALCRNTRCFGDDPEKISEITAAMVRGLQDEGMVTTAKHYPSCSDILCDTHLQMDESSLTEDEMLERDLVPYKYLMENADLSGIMTEHVIYKNIDEKNVTTLSKKVIDIIRRQGFDGLIVTDSFAMMAIVQNYGLMECIGLAVAAGCDMVLPNYRVTFKDSYEYLLKAYKEGVFTEERLDEAVRRVITAQNRTIKQPSQTEINNEQRELLKNMRKLTLAAKLEEGCSVKISEDTKKLFVLLCENVYLDPEEESKELMVDYRHSRKNMMKRKEYLLKEFPGSKAFIINEFPNHIEMEKVCELVSEVDEVIVFSYCRFHSYLGSDGITERIENLIKANTHKISTVIHCGNPYEIKKFKNVERIILNQYGIENDDCIVDVLKGKYIPQGVIPVKL